MDTDFILFFAFWGVVFMVFTNFVYVLYRFYRFDSQMNLLHEIKQLLENDGSNRSGGLELRRKTRAAMNFELPEPGNIIRLRPRSK